MRCASVSIIVRSRYWIACPSKGPTMFSRTPLEIALRKAIYRNKRTASAMLIPNAAVTTPNTTGK